MVTAEVEASGHLDQSDSMQKESHKLLRKRRTASRNSMVSRMDQTHDTGSLGHGQSGYRKLVRTPKSRKSIAVGRESTRGLGTISSKVESFGRSGVQTLVRALAETTSPNSADRDGERSKESDLVADEVKSHGLAHQQEGVSTSIHRKSRPKDKFRSSADLEGGTIHKGDIAGVIVDAGAGSVRASETHLQHAGIPDISRRDLVLMVIFLLLLLCAFIVAYTLELRGYWSNQQLSRFIPPQVSRAPTNNMKMDLVIQVQNALNLPNLILPDLPSEIANEIDPYVEISCVKGDPRTRPGGHSDTTGAKAKGRTHSKHNDVNPIWNETLTLSKVVYGPEYFINIVLWQSNDTSQNAPIGSHSIELSKFVSGLQYDSQAESIPFKDYTADNFINLLGDESEVIPSIVNLSISYLEVHKFEVSIFDAILGADDPLDVFVEIRIVHDDPLTQSYPINPHQGSHAVEAVWHGRTKTVHGSTDPKFNDDMKFIIAADPAHYMIICVTDASNVQVSSTPIGMTVLPMKKVMGIQDGFTESFYQPLEKVPNWSEPAYLHKARLNFSVSHQLSIANE
jgi:hypothetical protein